jgi:AraC family transcriptional regulator
MVRVLPANTRTCAYWKEEHQFMILAFEPELLAQYAQTNDINLVELLPIINPSDPLIHSIGLTLKTELELDGIGGRLYVDAMVTALMTHLLRDYSVRNHSLTSVVNGLSKRTLQRVVDYIHEHLDRDLTLAMLATIARMSPSYFSRLFKQSTKLPPHQYACCNLLYVDNSSIKIISNLRSMTSQNQSSSLFCKFSENFYHQR